MKDGNSEESTRRKTEQEGTVKAWHEKRSAAQDGLCGDGGSTRWHQSSMRCLYENKALHERRSVHGGCYKLCLCVTHALPLLISQLARQLWHTLVHLQHVAWDRPSTPANILRNEYTFRPTRIELHLTFTLGNIVIVGEFYFLPVYTFSRNTTFQHQCSVYHQTVTV